MVINEEFNLNDKYFSKENFEMLSYIIIVFLLFYIF
jgi:hypothetical protein